MSPSFVFSSRDLDSEGSAPKELLDDTFGDVLDREVKACGFDALVGDSVSLVKGTASLAAFSLSCFASTSIVIRM